MQAASVPDGKAPQPGENSAPRPQARPGPAPCTSCHVGQEDAPLRPPAGEHTPRSPAHRGHAPPAPAAPSHGHGHGHDWCGARAGLILRDGTWDLKQQCPSTWPEPPLKWAALWGSHYPSSRPLGPQRQTCVQPRALPARSRFLPLPFLGGHSTLNSTLTSAPHSTPSLHFLPGSCYCSSLSELGFPLLVAHERPK